MLQMAPVLCVDFLNPIFLLSSSGQLPSKIFSVNLKWDLLSKSK